ncbi:MAG TPA: BTAD domain-containing putative transcriptional regulator [Anaerolineales bacterium]|nr:BTAD domain-containing putative transcriptional regulator [Anaerolineales bacterium]
MHLKIQLLGTPQFLLDDKPVTASRRAVVALLSYLAVMELEHPGQRFSRDSLAELLWTDYDPAKGLANLRHTLWEVAQFIGEGWVGAEHEVIYLNPGAYLVLDLAEFRSLLGQASRLADPALRIPLLAEAVRLYRGEFLKGFTLKEGASFNEWVLARAEALRRQFSSTLEVLVEEYRTLGQTQAAIPYAQRLIELDPLNEAAHSQLMELYASADQHTAAMQQYKTLEKLLRKELNLDPQPETRELYKKIRKGELKPASSETRPPRHNLPVHLTTFIGRQREREEIGRLLAQYRLVTLTGAGGIGKTRLAVETGNDVLKLFPHGVWFIPFESLNDEDLVPQSAASLLRIAQRPQETLIDSLLRELQGKSLLLILDNCEHLLNAIAGFAEALLKNCPSIRVLATSRQALQLEGEAFYNVPALDTPTPQPDQAVEEFGRYESIKLFLERARLAVSDFQLTKTNADSIVQICSRLDGIPLAIELAAAHVDIFAPGEILKQLNRSFDLLASSNRSILPRQQTMRTSIDWGWNLLTEAERMFMRQLSVFVGGWTLQAAQAIGLSEGRLITGSLLKKSLVIVQQRTEDETRFRFHEVIRSYAHEKLRESGEEQTLRDRHLNYFLEMAKQCEPALQGIDQEQWLARLFSERDNLRAALEWSAMTNIQAGLYISKRLRMFWESYDLREEARWLLTI